MSVSSSHPSDRVSQPLPLPSGARNAIFKDLPNSKLRRTVLGTVLFSAFYASLLRCLRSRVLFAARFAMIRVTAGCGAHNFCLVHHRDWISCELAQRRLARCPECRVQIQQDPAAARPRSPVNVGIRAAIQAEQERSARNPAATVPLISSSELSLSDHHIGKGSFGEGLYNGAKVACTCNIAHCQAIMVRGSVIAI